MHRLFGILASISIVVSYIPQIKQTFTTKDVSGQNLKFWFLLTFSVSYFFIDAITKQVGLVTILAQLCNLLGAGSMLLMVYLYQKKSKPVDNSLDIFVKYLSDDCPSLEKVGGKKSDWVDVRVDSIINYRRNGKPLSKLEVAVLNRTFREDGQLNIKQGDTVLFGLGVAMQLPEGYEAYLAPRSSTNKHWNFLQTNSFGVIDEEYNGDTDEWGVEFLCVNDTTIERHSRVGQFRIQEHQPDLNLIPVDKLGNDDRGGFGSSGRK